MSIAGVTGTLSQLEVSRQDILEDKYKINKYTYIPTMFKENGLSSVRRNLTYFIFLSDGPTFMRGSLTLQQ